MVYKNLNNFIKIIKRWLSVASSVVSGVEHIRNGNCDGMLLLKDVIDIGIGIFSIYGGPLGVAVGTAYTLYNIYKESELSKKY